MHPLARLIEKYQALLDLSQAAIQDRARDYDPESGFGGVGSTRIHQLINEPQPNVMRTRTLRALAYALGAAPSEVVAAALETAGLPLPVDPNTKDPVVSFIRNANVAEGHKAALEANYARHRQVLLEEYRVLLDPAPQPNLGRATTRQLLDELESRLGLEEETA